MEFKPYQSRPVTRMAFQITKNHVIIPPKSRNGAEYKIGFIDQGNEIIKPIEFKAYTQPKVGDYIIQNPGEANYHCDFDTFLARNIVV